VTTFLENEVVRVEVRLLDADQGDTVITVERDDSVGAGVVCRSQQICQVREPEIADVHDIVGRRTGGEVVDGVVAGSVLEHEQVVTGAAD